MLIVRRTTFEWVLREAALAEPGVTIRTAATVEGLTSTASADGGRPPDGHRRARWPTASIVAADVVVAAMGRRSPVPAWLAELGVEVPETDPRERPHVPDPLVPPAARRRRRARPEARRRPRAS